MTGWAWAWAWAWLSVAGAAGAGGGPDVPLALWTNADYPNGLDFGRTNGISAGDYDQDGWVDAFAWASGNLWRNVGGVTWTVTDLDPIAQDPFSAASRYGASFADYDRDGFPELATEPRVDGCVHLLDNVDGAAWVLADDALDTPACGFAETIAWGDVDGDGWLDLFVPFYPETSPGNRFFRGLGRPAVAGAPWFAEQTDEAGLGNLIGAAHPEGCQLADPDDDGDLDLYCAGVVYAGDGAGGFAPLAPTESGIGNVGDIDEGAAFGDVDLDGDLDLVVANVGDRVGVWRNRGDGTFALAQGVVDQPGTGTELGLSLADWDHDGDLDLTTQGVFRRNLLAEQGALHYAVATDAIAPQHATQATPAWLDFDRDGDLDALLGNWSSTGHLYENRTYDASTPADAKRTVRIRALDDAGPDDPPTAAAGLETAFGAVVEVAPSQDPLGRRYRSLVASGAGYLNQDAYARTLALPAPDAVFDVRVVFPSAGGQPGWRVDRTVNAALGDLRLSGLVDGQVDVFRSGAVRIDGVVYPPDGDPPPLWSTGLAHPAPGAPLPRPAAVDAGAGTRWVGLALHTTAPTRIRALTVDGAPGAVVTCPGGVGNVLVWDTTDAPVLAAALVAPNVDGNDRHAVSADVVLPAGRAYRVVAAVTTERGVDVAPAGTGPVAVDGGFALTDADPCSGLGAASAESAPDVRYLALGVGDTRAVAAPPTATDPPDPPHTGASDGDGDGDLDPGSTYDGQGCGCGGPSPVGWLVVTAVGAASARRRRRGASGWGRGRPGPTRPGQRLASGMG